MKKCALFSIK